MSRKGGGVSILFFHTLICLPCRCSSGLRNEKKKETKKQYILKWVFMVGFPRSFSLDYCCYSDPTSPVNTDSLVRVHLGYASRRIPGACTCAVAKTTEDSGAQTQCGAMPTETTSVKNRLGGTRDSSFLTLSFFVRTHSILLLSCQPPGYLEIHVSLLSPVPSPTTYPSSRLHGKDKLAEQQQLQINHIKYNDVTQDGSGGGANTGMFAV